MRRKGFTLIEVAIITVVIGILAAALLPKLSTAKEKANNSRVIKQTNDIVVALESYHLYNNKYPVSPTCNGVVKSDCTLNGVKDELGSYLGIIPEGNNGTTGWMIGNSHIIPNGESYGYVGSGKYYILSYIFTDSRDGQKYRAVRMPDGKWWMADNLNYKTATSSCYGDIDANCENGYGRLYTWYEAPLVCPIGRKLPTHQDWAVMLNKVESIFGGAQNHGTPGIHLGTIAISYITANTDIFGLKLLYGGGYRSVYEYTGSVTWIRAANALVLYHATWDGGKASFSSTSYDHKYEIRCMRE